MEHQPVAEIVGFLRRKYGSELLFHLSRVLGAVGETQPASDPNAVGVGHHYAGFVKDVALNQVGGFRPTPGSFKRSSMAAGTLPPKSDNSIWSAADQIPALPIVEAAGVDVLGHLGGVRLGKGLQGWGTGRKGQV